MTQAQSRVDGAKPSLDPIVGAIPPKWRLGIAVALSWLQAIGTAVIFLCLGILVDGLLLVEPVAGWLWWAMVSALALTAISNGFSTWFSQWNMARSEQGLRQAVIGGIFALGPISRPENSGSMFSLATSAVAQTAHYRAGFLGPITGALTTPVVVLLFMAFTISPEVAGLLFMLLFIIPLLIGGFQKLVRPIGAIYRQATARLTAAFLESVQALETLVYTRAASRAAEHLAAEGQEHRRSLMKMLAGNQLLIFVVDASFSLAITVAATAIAVWKVSSAQLSAGQGLAMVLMSILIIGPVNVVGQFFYIGIGGRASQQAISSHLTSSAAQPVHPPGQADASAGIVLRNVTVGWTPDRPVLRSISLRVSPGERVAIVGPSGVGKSTLSAAIQAALIPSTGQVLVNGLDTKQHSAEQIRAQLSVIEQRSFLFVGSIAENLRLAKPTASEEELWAALDLAGLTNEVKEMPAGLDTAVGEHGMLLSGGQSQRLAIARAALREAPILILDEPTSQVDLAGEAAILAALDRLAAGRTVVMIAHRPNAILAADRVIRLSAEGVAA